MSAKRLKSTPKRKSRNRWLVLALVAIAQFMVVVDITIVNVALPSMQKALNISPENLQWIVTAYTLAFGGFLLLGGRAADLLGRKLIFIIGSIAFVLGSLLVGVAGNESMVIFARGLQGLAGAFMSPAALAIVLDTFAEGKERNQALSVWGAIASGGAAVGLLLGGVLTQYLDWRWNFFVNLPIGVLVALASIRYVPESKVNLGHRQFDTLGAISVTGGLMLLVYALTKAPEYGWSDPQTIWMLVLSGVILGLFLINEHKRKHPLMPLSFFAIKNVGRANLVMFPVAAAMFAMFFFLTLYVQNILGYSPVKTGVAFLPVAITIGLVAGVASQLITKVGFKSLLVAGPVFIAVALVWMAQLPVDGSYFTNVFPPLITLAVGMGLAFVSGTIAATTGVTKKDSGLASGLLNTSQQIGGALGLAVLSAVSASYAKKFIEELGANPTAPDQVAAAVHGYQAGFYTGAGFAVFSVIVAILFIRRYRIKESELPMPGA